MMVKVHKPSDSEFNYLFTFLYCMEPFLRIYLGHDSRTDFAEKEIYIEMIQIYGKFIQII
jgi:hypothetical protein